MLLTLTVINGYIVGWNSWATGVTSGMTIISVLDDYFARNAPYRRWYLMCRNVCEDVYSNSTDPNLHDDDFRETSGRQARAVLEQIGPRTSKREKWEL